MVRSLTQRADHFIAKLMVTSGLPGEANVHEDLRAVDECDLHDQAVPTQICSRGAGA